MMDGTGRVTVRIAVAVVVVLVAGCQVRDEEEVTCTVEIVTVPEGGEVSFSGRDVGAAPVTIENVVPKSYLVHVKKPGFDGWSRMVQVTARDEKIVVRAELNRKMASVAVTSTPAQAQFYHEDGTLIGVTPFYQYAPVGQYQMRFSKENYEDKFVQVTIAPDGTTHVVATLRPMKARVTVTTEPGRASIFIDEIERGYKTPATFELDAGLRTIGVSLDGYSREEHDIQVEPNAEIDVHFDLHPGNVPARMVKVPKSTSVMGSNTESPDERPRHKVVVNTFYIDKYEVTNARYQRFKKTHTFPPEMANHPVVNVTWHEAVEYAERIGKRLPTEAEWEKAAAGDDGRTYPWGNVFDKSFCNVKSDLAALLNAVGRYPEGRSPYGCYDMAGNVWEWIADEYGPYSGNADMRNVYGQQFRVIRGGAYSESAFHARCANRDYERPNVGRPDIGFRCAMSASADISDADGSE